MQGKQQEAKKSWDEFTVLRDPHIPARSHDIHFEFDEFAQRVGQLQKAIQEVAAEKKKYFALLLPLVVYIFFTFFSKLRKIIIIMLLHKEFQVTHMKVA